MAVRQGLTDLAQHGPVEVTGTDAELDLPGERIAACRAMGISPWAVYPVSGLQVRLTDLGRHTVRQRLLAGGVTAPLAAPASGLAR